MQAAEECHFDHTTPVHIPKTSISSRPRCFACDLTTIAVFTCAVSGDGLASIADVQTIINEAPGVTSAVDDLDHDGAVRVGDVQKALNAALWLGCPYN